MLTLLNGAKNVFINDLNNHYNMMKYTSQMLLVAFLCVTTVCANGRKGSGTRANLDACMRLCDNIFEQCLTLRFDCPLISSDDISETFKKCSDAYETCKEKCTAAFSPASRS
ncbi:hypothetical protein LSAT2_016720 [Lamellibrachia satsuma]|nr:hypothetical protein LSAT2_016720 [Lamellibrachia satsuma]